MDEVVSIVHKHDGIVWGEYVWSKFNSSIRVNRLSVRFVNLNLFGELAWPRQFLMDMYQSFKIVKISPGSMTVYDEDSGSELVIDVRVHGAVNEITFADEVDFTVNLVDYSRTGYSLRKVPACIALEDQPYETVIRHVREKILRIVNVVPAMETVKRYIQDGWSMDDGGEIVTDLYVTTSDKIHANHYKDVYGCDCSICNVTVKNLDMCVRTPCLHVFHLDCIKQWFTKSLTCPMCREQI